MCGVVGPHSRHSSLSASISPRAIDPTPFIVRYAPALSVCTTLRSRDTVAQI
ncbi:uncharacterized protein LAESUDRAFT_730832 [Laetiporus sulphureus 93-53]|uniref:Uncharacterized protein n=1 Tax=Laetiporus sulphureus 93-53 TaxID=1314785 RepID=A0A165BZ95_9APHY|nr:uncharacterized protein LAESUDRAFT_730832 [Laetiporus sulphureus 93-53]KZT01921.1 hypothetical protein LAESUDRAFT_730832 [Laetiporus sulphureus 93-53]